MFKNKVSDWRNGEPSFTSIGQWGLLLAWEDTFNNCRNRAYNQILMAGITPPTTNPTQDMQILLPENVQIAIPSNFYESAYIFGLSNSDWTLFKTKASDWRFHEPSFTGDIGQWALLFAWEGAFNQSRELARAKIIAEGYVPTVPGNEQFGEKYKWILPVAIVGGIGLTALGIWVSRKKR